MLSVCSCLDLGLKYISLTGINPFLIIAFLRVFYSTYF
jgi:hypothetical protein